MSAAGGAGFKPVWRPKGRLAAWKSALTAHQTEAAFQGLQQPMLARCPLIELGEQLESDGIVGPRNALAAAQSRRGNERPLVVSTTLTLDVRRAAVS